MDYDFSRLSTRSFEQMVQSISLAVMGAGVTIFGDGPDGGREATFEDVKSFPNSISPWSGYGVIQAKFRQRPGAKNGSWAVKELRAELTKLSKTSGLKKPEFYIFVTNVALTPVAGTGGKDRISSLIDKYKSNIGIKDFRVWDYDQLCAFLDSLPAIRTAYRAWITPGDVLAAIMDQIQPQTENFREIMLNFVQKELRGEQYVNLGQAGHNSKDRIPLASVFVDLPIREVASVKDYDSFSPLLSASEREGSVKALAKLSLIAGQFLDGESFARRQSLLVHGVTRHPGKVVFIGGPGQGKSTLTQFFCQLHRCSFIKQHATKTLNAEVDEACRVITAQCAEESIDPPQNARFPLRVELNKFAASLANGGCTSLFGFILNRIKERSERDLKSDDLRGWLSNYPWLIALDGLDEVPASSNRGQVLSSIQDFLIDAADCNADLLLIATSRPQGYDDDFSESSYTHFRLSELDADHALHYARKLINRRWGDEEDKVQTLLSRMRRACKEKSTIRLMKSPLQVTIMALLVESLGEPPKERWRLFNEYYHVINRREKERDIPAAKLLNSFQADIDYIHQKVGVHLQIESERSGKTDALLTEIEFSDIINSRLVAEGHTGENGEKFKNDVIEAALERLVFLVAPQEGRIGFEIRSLQEFMAAQAITSGRDDEIITRLRSIAHATHWRNVFLFAAGRCFHERQYLRDSIFTICSELNEGVSGDIGSCINKVLLTGSELALDIVDDGAISNQPSQLKIFTRLALRLLELPPNILHSRLSQAYQPEVEDLYQEAIHRELNRIDFKSRLGAWQVIVELADRNISWAKELAEKEWPADPAEVLSITSRMIAREPSKWVNDRWFSAILSSSPASAPMHYLPEIGGLMGLSMDEDLVTIPEWYSVVTNLMKVSVRRDIEIEGVSEEFIFQGNDFVYQSDTDLEDHELKGVHPGWCWLYRCARFLRKGDKESLADIIYEASFLMRSKEIFKLENWVWVLPWQITAIVKSTDSADELVRISQCIREGELGDKADWIEAMERWEGDLVRVADLTYRPKSNLPFDSDIGVQGFTAFSFHGDARHDEFEIKIFDQLLSIYQMDLPAPSKMLLANSIMLLISLVDESDYFPDYVCESLPDIISFAVLDWVDMTILNHIPDSFWLSENMFKLVSALIRKSDSWVYDSIDVDIGKLVGFVNRNPGFSDGVILLSKFSRVGREIDIPVSLSLIELASDFELKEAYLVLALAKLDCSIQDALRMAVILDEMAAALEGRNYLYCVVEMLRESATVTNATEAFLYSILNKEISANYSSQRDITHLLKQHQAYHLSHDPEMLS
ncbi:hypothetical protein D3C71_577790 [compost metagenome]